MNKIQEQQEPSFAKVYNNLVESLKQTSKEAIGEIKNLKSNKIWWNEEFEIMV